MNIDTLKVIYHRNGLTPAHSPNGDAYSQLIAGVLLNLEVQRDTALSANKELKEALAGIEVERDAALTQAATFKAAAWPSVQTVIELLNREGIPQAPNLVERVQAWLDVQERRLQDTEENLNRYTAEIHRSHERLSAAGIDAGLSLEERITLLVEACNYYDRQAATYHKELEAVRRELARVQADVKAAHDIIDQLGILRLTDPIGRRVAEVVLQRDQARKQLEHIYEAAIEALGKVNPDYVFGSVEQVIGVLSRELAERTELAKDIEQSWKKAVEKVQDLQSQLADAYAQMVPIEIKVATRELEMCECQKQLAVMTDELKQRIHTIEVLEGALADRNRYARQLEADFERISNEKSAMMYIPTSQWNVFKAVFHERQWQQQKWGNKSHEFGAWLLIAQGELDEAKLAWQKGRDDEDAKRESLQVIAVLTAALEQYGVTERKELSA